MGCRPRVRSETFDGILQAGPVRRVVIRASIESPGRDEIAWLRTELNGMRKKLRKMALEVRRTADGVNDTAAEINQAVVHIDTMTRPNAAPFEQSAAAAPSLPGQSGQLSSSMGSFRVVA